MFAVPSLSLSLSLCSVFLSAPFFSLSFFLRCWGNPNPFSGVWDSLVSLLRGHTLPPGPVRQDRQLHLGQAPAPVFFSSSSSSFAGMVVVGLDLLGLSLFGGVFLGFGFRFGGGRLLHAHALHRLKRWGPSWGSQTIIWRPHYDHGCFWGMSEDPCPVTCPIMGKVTERVSLPLSPSCRTL